MYNKGSNMKKIIILVLLLVFFVTAIYMSFTHLLKPKSSLNSKTLGQISNPYQEARALKGNIYDCNGSLLLGNVITNEDGSYQLISERDKLLQEQSDFKRLLLDDDNPACWSNVLPVLSGGLDSAFTDILQDIPLNSEDKTDIALTIDKNIQSDAYKILSARNYSSAVVMDCKNGDLLAMVSRPSYDYNTFREGSIPYASYLDNGQFFNNVDNAHDCVQDYYKLWKNAYQEDNSEEKNIKKWTEGTAVRALRSDLTENRLMFSESEAQKQLDYWNHFYHSNFHLQDCIEINFSEIYEQEQEFYKDSNEGEFFVFDYEPEALGKGTEYIPFFKITISDKQSQTTQVRYLKLCYGNNNFIYEDCVANDFEPNFSFQNYALSTSAPGSCFKILLTALLADEVNESMLTEENGITTVNVANEYESSAKPSPLPTLETSRRSHSNLIDALSRSSNQYFSMTAIMLDRILHTQDSSYLCTYQDILNLDTETIQNSGALLLQYYQDKFCINANIDSYFYVPSGRILSCLDNIQIAEQPDENDLQYDDNLWYSLDEKGEIQQAYTDSKISLAQKIGDTAYGQGYNRISPVFMAMSIGKCLTGTMYIPNVLAEESGNSKKIGEDFNRATTVSFMQDALEAVYDNHTDYVPDGLSFQQQDFKYYAKTGTSSVDKGSGTQSTYGLFAEMADYPTQPEDENKYQIIWYVGAVSDGTNCYAIVLRSYFDNDSYSLKKEFLQIVDSLYQNGYLIK